MSTLTDRLQQQFKIIGQTRPETQTRPFTGWRPDLPSLGNAGEIVARNVIPGKFSYRPFGTLSTATGALDARARGAIRARDSAGNYYNYAGDAAKLYEVRASGITNKSKAGGYSTAGEDNWSAVLYKDQVVFTNYADAVQVLTAGGAGNFADLITSTEKPKAKHCATVGQFLVLGNINSTADGVKPNRIHWSGFGDIADFDPDAQTQSDYEDLTIGGAVQRILGGLQYGLVFQQSAVRRMVYPAGAAIFDLAGLIDRQRGAAVPGAVVGHGRLAFYLSEEGFHMTDGTQSYDIGENQLNRTFWKQFDVGNAHLVSAAIDPLNKLYVVAFPDNSGVGKIYFYYWPDQRWSEAEVDVDLLANTTSESISLEDLDSLFADLDSITVSLDSAQFRGGGLLFGAFGSDHKLGYFDGANLAATIETGEAEIFEGHYARVSKLRPLIDGGSIMGSVGARDTQQAAVVYSTPGSLDDIGEIGVDDEHRYHRSRFTIAAGGTWEHAQGVQIQVSRMGTAGFS